MDDDQIFSDKGAIPLIADTDELDSDGDVATIDPDLLDDPVIDEEELEGWN